MVFDHSTIQVGLLALDKQRAVYTTTSAGVQFAVPLSSITVEWLSWAKLTRGCDFQFDGFTYRLYFAKPFEDVADLNEDQAEGLASDINKVFHGVSEIVQGRDLVGTLLKLPAAIKEQQAGIKIGDAVSAWLEAAR